MIFRQFRVLAVAGALAASAVTLGAAAASAGVTPTPTYTQTPPPVPTPTCAPAPPIRFAPTATPTPDVSLSAKITRDGGYPTPPPVVTPQCRPWTFDVDQSDIAGLAVNDVEGSGAIPMSRWADTQGTNPAVDTFSDGRGDSVTLLHSTLPVPDVNLATCTVTFDQPGGRFVILRGTGTGARWRSFNGQFDLLGMVSFPSIRHHRGSVLACPLRFLSPGTILRAIEYGTPVRGLPAPTFQDFSVQGSALLARR